MAAIFDCSAIKNNSYRRFSRRLRGNRKTWLKIAAEWRRFLTAPQSKTIPIAVFLAACAATEKLG